MTTQRKRLVAITGAALALVIASSAAVSAAGPRDDDRGFPFGKSRVGAKSHARDFDRGMRTPRAGLRAGLGAARAVVRSETVVNLGENGFVTHRVDNGTASAASDSGLEYTLATGETASVTTDENTQVVAVGTEEVKVGRRGRTRQRLTRSEIAVADIAADSAVSVWARSDDGDTFVASRIIVLPSAPEAAEEMTEDADAAEAEDAAADGDADSSAVTDA